MGCLCERVSASGGSSKHRHQKNRWSLPAPMGKVVLPSGKSMFPFSTEVPLERKLDQRTHALLRSRFGLGEPTILRRSVDPGPIGDIGISSDPRVDLSWISTEQVDHEGDVLLASGMDDSVFALNPIVTLNHDYGQAPIGRSLWRKQRAQSGVPGIVAATHYPPKPTNHPSGRDWMPDVALGLVRSGLAVGKSVGFVILAERPPNTQERRSGWSAARRVIEKWLLLEYAVCWMPANPGAVLLPESTAPKSTVNGAMQFQRVHDGEKSQSDEILKKAEILSGI